MPKRGGGCKARAYRCHILYVLLAPGLGTEKKYKKCGNVASGNNVPNDVELGGISTKQEKKNMVKEIV